MEINSEETVDYRDSLICCYINMENYQVKDHTEVCFFVVVFLSKHSLKHLSLSFTIFDV